MEKEEETGMGAGDFAAKADIGALTGLIAGELAPFMPYVMKYMVEPTAAKIDQKIAEARATDLEALPPDVVRYCVVAKDVLEREGYTLTFAIGDWHASSGYAQIVVRPVRKDNMWDVLSYDDPPVLTRFIISKETNRLATRAEITTLLQKYNGDEPVNYEDEQIHGLEMLVDGPLVPGSLGAEVAILVAIAFSQAMGKDELQLKRRNVPNYCEGPDGYYRGYGFSRVVLYIPQEPEEANEFKPPTDYHQHVLSQRQKKLPEQRLILERVLENYRRVLMTRLIETLKAYA